MASDYTFALCLSHDVDRIYKTYQYVYQTIVERDPRKLIGVLSPKNPYWQFEEIMAIESRLGVRSSFNVLDEQHITERSKTDWLSLEGWQLYGGRYDVTDPKLCSTLRVLDEHGWEIALQGSYESSEHPSRFGYEKGRIEHIVGTRLAGNRQHHWNLSRPDTWKSLREAGIEYDTSLGSSETIEFQHGHEIVRPFDDEFVVFPWTLMDGAVMGSGDSPEEVWANCERLLEETRDHRSVLVADWHQRVFYEPEFPGWASIYDRLIRRALEMGAWVGPPGEFYDALPHPDGRVDDALEALSSAEEPLYA